MFKIDFLNGTVLAWEVGGGYTKITDYTPTLYVSADRKRDLIDLRQHVVQRHDVITTGFERWRTGWRHEPQDVLRVDVASIDRINPVAYTVRRQGTPGKYKLYNVDFSPQFRYCLEQAESPIPNREMTTLSIEMGDKQVNDEDITNVRLNGEEYTAPESEMLETIQERIDDTDPDVLVVSHASIVPLLYDKADKHDTFLRLGRLAGWQQLAGDSTFHSYGRIGNSPARYNVPGRAIINLSNSFFYDKTNLDGMLYLVERSWKPIQELAWASIGNVLTGIQIRHAIENNVLVAWNSWRAEFYKSMATLHDSDRGGYTFAPTVGVHENVYEADYSSLYPNIMITRNVSPETVRCDCCDNDAVPGLGYSICERTGYLTNVLRPLIEDREDIKQEIREADDAGRLEQLEGMSDAIKWVLVSCFGYQGFSNAKFGRIEAHEAINAYAREILLDTKEAFEQNGWKVVHGIVDSIWVQPIEGEEQVPITEMCDRLTEQVGITLDYENRYDWIAFCPKRESGAGALTRYFGKKRDGGFKVRGIEARQRSTPPYVAECQRDMLEAFDTHRTPEAVCDLLKRQVQRLRSGNVDADDLLVRKRVSKEADQYQHHGRNVAALERADLHGFGVQPGEDVRFVVVNDGIRSVDRVRLHYEDGQEYDADYYTDLLVRAAESVVSPMGWDRNRIERYLSDTVETGLRAYL